MKTLLRILGLFLIYISILGCATEMKITELYVEQNETELCLDKYLIRYRGIFDNTEDAYNAALKVMKIYLADYFYVAAIDSNGKMTEIPYNGCDPEKASAGVYYLQTESGEIDKPGDWIVRIVYVPGGNYHNYNSKIYSKDTYTIRVKSMTVESIALVVGDNSCYVQGLTWDENIKAGYVGSFVQIKYQESSTPCDFNTTTDFTINGISEKSLPGEHKISVTYGGKTSAEVPIWVVQKVVNTDNITYYDNTADSETLDLSPKFYTNIDATVDLPSAATKSGFTFIGWYDNKDLSGDAITQIPNGTRGNKTFYAKWQPQ